LRRAVTEDLLSLKVLDYAKQRLSATATAVLRRIRGG
jgi:hypothetical protein